MKSLGEDGPVRLKPMTTSQILFSLLLFLGQVLVLPPSKASRLSSRQEVRRDRKGIRSNDSCLSSFKRLPEVMCTSCPGTSLTGHTAPWGNWAAIHQHREKNEYCMATWQPGKLHVYMSVLELANSSPMNLRGFCFISPELNYYVRP